MNEREEIRKELEELAPELARLKKTAQPEVPAGYFDRLPDEVMQRIKVGQKPPIKVRYMHRRLIWRAAAILLVAAIGTSLYIYLNRPTPALQWAALSMEERNAYIQDNIGDFDMDMIIETVDVGDLDYDWLNGSVNEEGLDEYLDEVIQDMDLEDIEQLL